MLTHNFPPMEGGISTHSYEMAKNWATQHRVWVLAPRASEGDAAVASFGGTLVHMPVARNRLSRLLFSTGYTLALAKKFRPDIIYGTHWRNTGIALRLAAMLMDVRFFLAVHGSEVLELLSPSKKFVRSLFNWVAGACSGFVALGQYQREILGKLGIQPGKMFTSPEGVDLLRWGGVEAGSEPIFRARMGLDGKPTILTVGRLVERKGHDVIIRALPQVLREVPNAVYVIVGRGAEEDRLRALAEEKGVKDHVVFCGFVPEEDLVGYYRSCDVFAMPNREIGSDTEGFGIVFVEAGACGKPVIGGRSGGAVEVIEHGVTGLLVNPCDVGGIAADLVLLLKDRELAKAMGRAARRRVEQRYSYRRIAADIAEYLQGATLQA